MTDDEHPDSPEGPLFVSGPEEGDELWVRTGHRLGEEKGIEYTDYAKIRVEETRTVRDVDTGTDQEADRDE